MRLTVLGSCGAWPEAGQAASGYLVEHAGFRLLVDVGYAVVPRLLELVPAGALDAVLVSHGHPDHCADLNPLLRARALGRDRAAPLPVYALPGALDAVLALDAPEMLAGAYDLHELSAGSSLAIGPFRLQTCPLAHSVPNLGALLGTPEGSLAYASDSGPSHGMAELARGADLLLAEASYVDQVPEESRLSLSSAHQRGCQAAEAAVGQLLLTHLLPGTDHGAARRAASRCYRGTVGIATAGLVVHLG